MGKNRDMTPKEREGQETLDKVLKGLRNQAKNNDTEARVREAKRIAAEADRRGIGKKRR